jgi:hypothetical protein
MLLQHKKKNEIRSLLQQELFTVCILQGLILTPDQRGNLISRSISLPKLRIVPIGINFISAGN